MFQLPAPRGNSTRAVWRAHPGYVMAMVVNIAGALYLGGTGVFAADSHFAAPTFDGLRQSLGVRGWSALMLAYGLILATSAWLDAATTKVVFWLGGMVYIAIGIYFALGMGDPHASPWGPIFLILGSWQITQAEAYRQSTRGPS